MECEAGKDVDAREMRKKKRDRSPKTASPESPAAEEHAVKRRKCPLKPVLVRLKSPPSHSPQLSQPSQPQSSLQSSQLERDTSEGAASSHSTPEGNVRAISKGFSRTILAGMRRSSQPSKFSQPLRSSRSSQQSQLERNTSERAASSQRTTEEDVRVTSKEVRRTIVVGMRRSSRPCQRIRSRSAQGRPMDKNPHETTRPPICRDANAVRLMQESAGAGGRRTQLLSYCSALVQEGA